MAEEAGEISHSVEGPQQKVEVHVSAKDFLNAGYPSHSPINSINWVLMEIENKLPEGEIKKAFTLANQERAARLKERVDLVNSSKFLVKGSEKYAFRGLNRRSDGNAMWQHENATSIGLSKDLHRHGIDVPGREENILPGLLWDIFTVPTPIDIEKGVDVMEVLVYRNKPFVLSAKSGETKTTLINLTSGGVRGKKSEISVDEAKKKGYPTLRDLLVGQTEVYFD